jgi:2'-5' RNA ligase
VNLPGAEKAQLGTILRELQRPSLPVRWAEPDALHITLKFLGEVAERRSDEITAALLRAAHGVAAFDVDISDFGAFPARSRPRTLWLGVTAPPEFRELHACLEREFEALGFAREAREFSPHLTLGRVKNAGRLGRDDVDRLALRADYHATFSVAAIDLMRSHLGAAGARHELIVRAALNAQRARNDYFDR